MLSWSIEAFRDGRTDTAKRYIALPGAPEDHDIPGRFFIPPWDLDALINEKFRLGVFERPHRKRLNLRSWDGIAKLYNAFHGLSNVESTMDFAPRGILAALPRMLWPQLDWQIGFENSERLGRAWYVYGTFEAKAAFREKYDLDLDTFLKCGFAVYAMTGDKPSCRMLPIPEWGISSSDMYRSCRIIGKTVPEHQAFSADVQNRKIPRVFNRSSVKEFPLVFGRQNGSDICIVPSRALLMLRITDGIYYDIVSDNNARRASGERFEILCESIARHYLSDDCNIEGERETSYGKSADIFVFHKYSDLSLIVECKARRLPQKVLVSPDPWIDAEDAFSDIIKAILQIWRSHNEFSPLDRKKIVGLIITYDAWSVMGQAFLSDLFAKSHAIADTNGIPESSRVTIKISSLFDFINCVHSYNFEYIHGAISLAINEKFDGYELFGILSEMDVPKNRKERFDFYSKAEESMPWWDMGSEAHKNL